MCVYGFDFPHLFYRHDLRRAQELRTLPKPFTHLQKDDGGLYAGQHLVYSINSKESEIWKENEKKKGLKEQHTEAIVSTKSSSLKPLMAIRT